MNKTGKYLFLLLALCLLLALLPVTAFATGTTEVSTWGELQAALSAGGDIILTGDVTPENPSWADALTVPSGVTATLDLNGHIVDRGLTEVFWNDDGAVIRVTGGTLTLIDSNPTATHTNPVTYTDPTTGDTVTVSGGVLTGGWPKQWGGGVYVNDATFTMNGGSIVGNSVGESSLFGADGCGGGVYMQSGSFTMNGGAICGNQAVTGTTAKGRGGGVYITGGTFNFTGGTISGNDAGKYGGGVYLASTSSGHDGTINVSGNASVKDNTVSGAVSNVYLEEGGVLDVTGALTGTIGVTMQTPGVFTSGWKDKMGETADPAKYFTSDDAGLVVSLTDAGEAQLMVEKYPLWVGGVQATSANKGDVLGDGTNVTYDPETQTLTFPENITLTGAHSNVVIYAVGQDLTVRAPNGLTLNNRDAMYGISTGSKALTVETGGVLAITVKDNGIDAGSGGVTVTGNVNITVGQQGIMTDGPVTVTGDVTIRSGGTYGIDARGKVELNGNIDIEANGFCILTYGDIALDYGTCTLTNNGSSYYAIHGNNITLEGTSLTAMTRANGFDCVLALQKLTLVRGDFSFTGGSRAIQANGDIEIQSGVTRVYGKCTSTSDSVICAYNNGEIKLADSLRIVTPEDGYIDNTNYSKIVDKNGNNVTEVVIERLYTVAVTPGANMTLTSGAASQTVTAGGAMESVVYTADEGYYFPEDYAVASVNGVAVTRDSFTQITVSGTPTWNAAITLTAPMAKGASVVTKAPEANTLSYSGSAQALVTAGTATGGELQYALGSETEATGAYSTSIPTAANVGTYYVWYKVIGDANHNDSKAAFVKVTISEKKANPTAPATTTQKKKETAPVKTNRLLNLKGSQTGSKITIKWTRIPDASMYKVYGAYCGKKMKLLKTIKGNTTIKAVFPKLNGKEINLKKEYKFRVIAYKTAGGKTKQISKSFDVHITGRNNAKYTSAKAIKVTKKNYRLEAGKKAKIKVKLVLANKKKKALPVSHGPRFRYVSSNKAVASVSKNGKITAKKAGTCTIYVYAINGCAAKVKVVVK